MTSQLDLASIARTVIDTNSYMTLATADRAGLPWPSPVWYAHSGYRGVLLGFLPRRPALAQPRRTSPGGHRHLRLPRPGRDRASGLHDRDSRRDDPRRATRGH